MQNIIGYQEQSTSTRYIYVEEGAPLHVQLLENRKDNEVDNTSMLTLTCKSLVHKCIY
jgi:hypothetical protein